MQNWRSMLDTVAAKVLVRVVWLASRLGRDLSVLVADDDLTFPLPVFSTCRLCVGRAEGHGQIRELTSEPSDSPAHCSSLLAPSF